MSHFESYDGRSNDFKFPETTELMVCVRCSYKRGRGSGVTVRVPPDRPVDVDVLDKQGHQQIEKEQELKQQAAVQRQLRDPRVADRLWSNEGRERRGRQTHRVTAP